MQECLAASITSAPGHYPKWNNSRGPRPVTNEPPLLFTRICREWRNISLRTPELWQSIRIDDTTPTVTPQVVRLGGSRAVGLPRNIQLEVEDPERGAELLAASMESCQQWRDIALTLDSESFSVLAAHHGPFAMLRSLSLFVYAQKGDKRIAIRDAPLLRKVSLFRYPAVDVAWDQLTALQMRDHDADMCISALQHCPNLTFLHVSGGHWERLSAAISPISLPALRSLEISSAPTLILPFLTAPRLEKVRLLDHIHLQQTGGDMGVLLARSACVSRALSFRLPPFQNATAYQAFFWAMSCVTDLELVIIFPRQLEKLGAARQMADVFPRLRTLRIMYNLRRKESFSPLVNALRSRQQIADGWDTLEAFYLVARHPVLPSNLKDELVPLREKGMDVSIELE